MEKISFSASDRKQLQEHGISEAEAQRQLDMLANGLPYLRLKCAASVDNCIRVLGKEEAEHFQDVWSNYRKEGHRITKFVPASGAASRMFKDLYSFLNNTERSIPETDFEKTFFNRIHDFAFYEALDDACHLNEDKGVDALISAGQYKTVVSCLLGDEGLEYGSLPKGLLQFHAYDDCLRTPVSEHLAEAALYASSQGEADVHFTVSHEHLEDFEQLIERILPDVNTACHLTFHISFSEQKPSTDTLAANPDGTPFRTEDGKLLFRPGGHGALIENLNELHSDIIFIKNIDNVVHDRLKPITVQWKEILAGLLVETQAQVFGYLRLLDSGTYGKNDIEDMIRFVRHTLNCDIPALNEFSDEQLVAFLRSKLNRPIRVCGMVRNVGEPGGGPFIVYNADGSVSPQILESVQIDMRDATARKMFENGTHFNPVDLVCATRDYKGQSFRLPDFVDQQAGFISEKSKDGKPLRALELPGLWNGAMSNWSTLMVEVPLETFNPVKTVNDLLRPAHQPVG